MHKRGFAVCLSQELGMLCLQTAGGWKGPESLNPGPAPWGQPVFLPTAPQPFCGSQCGKPAQVALLCYFQQQLRAK